MSDRPALRRTPLYGRHVAAGAKLVDFAGWEMPVQYGGVREEHLAARQSAAIFDVSHMGQIETSGPDAIAFLEHLLTTGVGFLKIGGAQYSLLLDETGGIVDDVITYRLLADRFITVTNASNRESDLAWFRSQSDGYDVQIDDIADRMAMMAVQGPAALEILQRVSDRPMPIRLTCRFAVMVGRSTLACGTGYAGENGAEIMCAPADAEAIWDAIVRGGATPAGLGARDTLRTEVCYPLYGNELSRDRNPVEAGLAWACRGEGYIGADVVADARANGTEEQLVAFTMPEGIARPGNPIIGGGVVTSGTMSPSLGYGIGMAYVPAARAAEGTELEIDVRGRVRSAVVAAKPLYRR